MPIKRSKSKSKASKKIVVSKRSIKTATDVPGSKDVPVTMGVFEAFRAELVGYHLQNGKQFKQIDSRFKQMDLKFKQIDRRFDQIDLKFDQIDLKFDQIDRRFEQIDLKFEQLDIKFTAKFDRVIALMEQQRAENSIVLDGLKNLFERQDRFEKETREEHLNLSQVINSAKNSRDI